jgi:hypothetical protein
MASRREAIADEDAGGDDMPAIEREHPGVASGEGGAILLPELNWAAEPAYLFLL